MNNETLNKTNYRWVICSMLFFATTVNYMDRQVLSLTWKDFIAPEFMWNDNDYGTITGLFSIFYAVACVFAGKFIDVLGTKKGYLWAIFIWSTGACLHSVCGWVTMKIEGLESINALRAVEAGSELALAVTSTSVWLFLACRLVLAMGEAGNFPAAIKVTAEYFPKKDRAFATSIFNSGASVGALVAPACIPLLARRLGWEMAFIIIGLMGYLWMGIWLFVYEKPHRSPHVNAAELDYIEQDKNDDGYDTDDYATSRVNFLHYFKYRQTWSFIVGKFMTDGVWWFFMFWAPAYFSDQYGYASDTPMGILLIFTLYAICTVLSIFGGYVPTYFVDKRGMDPYTGRMSAMLIFACFPILAIVAQPLGLTSVWWPAVIIGLVGAGHQAWSANLFSTVGDMFPKGSIATVTGIGTMAGGIGSFMINKGSGVLFTYAERQGEAFMFMGFTGKPAGYMIIFCVCAVAYLVGWLVMKSLVPDYTQVKLR